jgi:proteic killer suppression protein
MKIRNFIHKGLKRLYADDAAKGVPPDTVDKLRKMPAFLDNMDDPEELRALPSWKVHTLTGDRKGTWSLSVTANRRLTFCNRQFRARDLQREFRGLPLKSEGEDIHGYEESATSRRVCSDGNHRSCGADSDRGC